MLTPADNDRLTRVGPGTPMGTLLRRYWLPALLSEEVTEADGPPVRVRLLGEDLIAFRDTSGAVGLVSAYCPHRRAPMFFGRNEECGLRCVYHGWKFDRSGACVDMPSEPPDSLFKTKVRIESYPTWEAGSIVWAYLGPAELEPPHPDYELLRTSSDHRYVTKSFQECNYLQALEGGVDPTHARILHNRDIGDRSFLNNYDALVAEMDLEKTRYGFTYAGIRSLPAGNWVRRYHWIMPAYHVRGTAEGIQHVAGFDEVPTIDGHMWIPIDDAHVWVYNFGFSADPDVPLPREQAHAHETRLGRGDNLDANYIGKANKSNDYLIDRAKQQASSMTGINGINTQDLAVQEGMGIVTDRTREHLGTTDRAVITLRQILLDAVWAAETGGILPALDPATYRSIRAVDRIVPKDRSWREETRGDFAARY
jgi:phthalate 4,5-dioxygenase oxygenase subunit